MPTQLQVNTIYPINPEYRYVTKLERLDLDQERINDLRKNKGFIVTEPVGIKKDIKEYNGIFSTRFGQTLQDMNPYANRYSCPCKNPKLQGRVYLGQVCPICGEKVRRIGDELDYFGYIVLDDPYKIIHPNLFKSIEFIIGSKILKNILTLNDPKNEDGFSIEPTRPKYEPFFGIGIIKFIDNWEEILTYYINQNPNKRKYYDDVMENKGILFTQSIPVYTTLLRPFRIEGDKFFFEGANSIYQLMAKLAAQVNQRQLSMSRRATKPKDSLLWQLQEQYNELYAGIEECLAKKKGTIRSCYGGRYDWSGRCVISSDPTLKIDQVRLPYHALVELLQQVIINILYTVDGISYDNAYKIWYKAQIKENRRVWDIIDQLIKTSNNGNGIPILINRPPTIQYGSILYMNVVGINRNYTMSIPLQILVPLVADFDGDALSIRWIINGSVRQRAEEVFSPKYAFFISRNDGSFNNDVNHQRDIIIVASGLSNMCRKYYTEQELQEIRDCQNTPIKKVG